MSSRILSADEAALARAWAAPAVDHAGQPLHGGATTGGVVRASTLEDLQREAYDEAFRQGYRDGQAAGQREVAEEVRRLAALLDSLARPFEELDAVVEDELLQLALALAKQVVRRELRQDPTQIIAIVREAIAALPVAARDVRVHLHPEDAAIVRVRHEPKGARHRVALVGKGICFDTGGHNLKPARYMAGMHEDMNGSAVALALTAAVAELGLPIAIDCWLAIAHNHLSPEAYTQGDIVTTLDGTSIEVVHTDAEGRMVLADTLLLASGAHGKRARPDLVIDFATLTGSMHVALGTRYSGVFASSDELAAQAVAAGVASGERVCAFPFDADYDAALDSKVADVKQCTLDGDADHILAARFLRRFTGGRPWLHVDLSASSCSGGLGAAGSDITGFGVAWGLALLEQWRGRP